MLYFLSVELPATEMPPFVKGLVYTSVGIAAVISIFKNLKTLGHSKLLHFIAGELTRNGGETVKDLITRAMEDSAEALTVSKNLVALVATLDAKADTAAKEAHAASVQVRRSKKRLEVIHANVIDLEKRFARFIIHQTRNDLNASQLLHEEERLLADFQVKENKEKKESDDPA